MGCKERPLRWNTASRVGIITGVVPICFICYATSDNHSITKANTRKPNEASNKEPHKESNETSDDAPHGTTFEEANKALYRASNSASDKAPHGTTFEEANSATLEGADSATHRDTNVKNALTSTSHVICNQRPHTETDNSNVGK